MNSTLVVVVCDRDLWNFELLVKSMGKFMEPCRCIFIYNEDGSKMKFFKKWYAEFCEPYLKKFLVRVLHKDYFFHDYSLDDQDFRLLSEPIYNQQLLKLFVSEIIVTEKYTVLDCKNFITRPCKLADIKQTYPENITFADHYLLGFVLACCAKLDVRFTTKKEFKLSANITPFIMHKKKVAKLIKHFDGKKNLHIWMLNWCHEHSNMAEFYLYEIFCIAKGMQDMGEVLSNTITIWEHSFSESHMLPGIEFYVKYEEELGRRMGFKFYVAGLHTHTRDYINPEDIHTLLKYYNMDDCYPVSRGAPFKKIK